MTCLHAFLEFFAVADDSGLDHLAQQIISFACTFTHTGKDGESVVFLCDVVDQFHDQYRFADSGSSEKSDLASFGVRFQ